MWTTHILLLARIVTILLLACIVTILLLARIVTMLLLDSIVKFIAAKIACSRFWLSNESPQGQLYGFILTLWFKKYCISSFWHFTVFYFAFQIFSFLFHNIVFPILHVYYYENKPKQTNLKSSAKLKNGYNHLISYISSMADRFSKFPPPPLKAIQRGISQVRIRFLATFKLMEIWKVIIKSDVGDYLEENSQIYHSIYFQWSKNG